MMKGRDMGDITSDIGRRAIVPEWVLDLDISPNAIRLYATLDAKYADRSGLAWPTRRTLANDLRVSADTIDRTVAELSENGALTVEKRTSEHGDPTSNAYRLVHARPSGVPIGSRKGAATPMGTGAATGSRMGAATISNPVPIRTPGPDRTPARASARAALSAKPPTARETAAIEKALRSEAVAAWLRAAERKANPYTTAHHQRQVADQAVAATRWEDGATVIAAISERMDHDSAPIRIPEWARDTGAARRDRDHTERKMREAEQAKRLVYKDSPDGRTAYLGHVPVLSGGACTKCGQGLDKHAAASKDDLARMHPFADGVRALARSLGAEAP